MARCTDETVFQVESVGSALEEWTESPEAFDSTRFDQLANETTETLDSCESDVRELYEEIEAETIVPEEATESSDGEEIVASLEDLFETAEDGQTAAEELAATDGDPEALADDEEAVVESVVEEYDDVIEDVEPITFAEAE